MMAFGFMEVLMLLLCGGGGGNDLLDYLPSDAYWRAKGAAVSVEAMAAELAAGGPADVGKLIRDLGAEDFNAREAATQKLRALGPAAALALQKAAESDDPEVRTRAQGLLKATAGGAQGKAVRRLMAIRALGELKKPEGLAALRPLLDSKALFEADYAQAAIAAIEGKPYARPRPAPAALHKDLCLLPARCGIVAQATMPPGGPVAFEKVLKEAAGMLPPGQDATALLDQAAKAVLTVAERTGNVRLFAATLGVSDDVGDNKGFAVVVVRGLYDAQAASAALAQLDLTLTKVGGLDVFSPEREVGLIPCSNERFVVAIRAREDQLSVEDLAAAIKRDGDQPALDAKMLDLIKSINIAGPMWAAVRMTDAYRQGPVLAPFDTATLASKEKGEGVVDLALAAVGKDPAAVKVAADEIQKGLAEASAEVKREAAQMPFLKSIAEIIDTIRLKADGGNLTITATVKGSSSVLMMPVMLFGVKRSAGPHPPMAEPMEAVPE